MAGNRGIPYTRSPGAKEPVPGPAASIRPATSQPGMYGGLPNRSPAAPDLTLRSTGLTPAAVTRTSTSPGAGSGDSVSTRARTSGPPKWSTRIARIACHPPGAACEGRQRMVSGGYSRIPAGGYRLTLAGVSDHRSTAVPPQNGDMTLPVLKAHTLVTEDGVPIDAAHLPGDPGLAIVLAHGFTLNWQRPAVWRIARRLSKYGGVVIFDFRGHGRSGGLSTLGDREIKDVAVAVGYARELGYQRVAIVGFSMGASIVLRYAGLVGGGGTPGSPPAGGIRCRCRRPMPPRRSRRSRCSSCTATRTASSRWSTRRSCTRPRTNRRSCGSCPGSGTPSPRPTPRCLTASAAGSRRRCPPRPAPRRARRRAAPRRLPNDPSRRGLRQYAPGALVRQRIRRAVPPARGCPSPAVAGGHPPG